MKPPILICGCPGSGTSLVTKILRHAGLFTGIDSGPADARKYHESQCFKRYNEDFLNRTIAFPHAPKSVDQFTTHNRLMREQIETLAESVERSPLVDEFFGSPETNVREDVWGWKDPRNSATAMIWREVFPQLRMIVVDRNWRWRDRWLRRKSSGTESGNWYRNESTQELRQLYRQPIGMKQVSTLYVDVDQLTTSADFLGRALTWCGLSAEPASRFDALMDEIGLER